MFNFSAIYPSQNTGQSNQYRRSNQSQFTYEQPNYKNQMMSQRITQCYQEEQRQDQALIQYYIYEDFQNLINLIYSQQTVSEYFKNDPNNEVVIMSRNKVISQLNLSNTIHLDVQQNYKDPKYQQLIKKEKQKVKELISQLPQHIQNSKYLNLYYQNSLSDHIVCNQQRLEMTNTSPNFNQDVVQKVFSSMQLVDKSVNQIKSQNYYPIPTKNDILVKARQYETLTKNKLEASFPKKQEYQSQIYYGYDQQQQLKQQFDRHQSWQNSPQISQSQIISQPKQQRYSSIQSNQQNQSNSNYIRGYRNLGC